MEGRDREEEACEPAVTASDVVVSSMQLPNRRPRFRRTPRPLSIKIRQEEEEDSSDDDDDDGEDSPSPTTTTFPDDPATATATTTGAVGEAETPSATSPSVTSTSSTTTTSSSSSSSSTTTNGSSSSSSSTSTASSSSSSTTTSITGPVPTVSPQADRNGIDDQRTGDATLGIAFGVIGAASIVLCIGLAIWWLVRCRRRRDAAETLSSKKDGARGVPQMHGALSNNTPNRSPSELMDQLMTAAYDAENGQGPAAQGWTHRDLGQEPAIADEKFAAQARSHQIPILQPAPVALPVLRASFSDWIRNHNPLTLNPLSRRASIVSRAHTYGSQERSSSGEPADHGMGRAVRNDDEERLLPLPVATAAPASGSHSYGPEADDDVSPLSSRGFFRAPKFGEGREIPVDDFSGSRRGQVQSVAITEHTAVTATSGDGSESSWASWGAGVTRPRPRPQPNAQPEDEEKGWTGKMAKMASSIRKPKLFSSR